MRINLSLKEDYDAGKKERMRGASELEGKRDEELVNSKRTGVVQT